MSTDSRAGNHHPDDILDCCVPTFRCATWNIKEFHEAPQKHKEFVKSPIFIAGPHKELELCIHLFPKGDEFVKAGEYLSIHPVLLNNKCIDTVQADFHFQVPILVDGNLQPCIKSFSVHIKPEQLVKFPIYSECAFLSSLYLRFKILQLQCTASVRPLCITQQVFETYGSILCNKKYCDVSLVVNGKEIQAHKIVLASRSPVFAAMFDHDMKEKISNIVHITDFDSDVFEDFVLFLYTFRSKFLAQTPIDWRAVADLMTVAEKYQVSLLKTVCAKCLERNLTIDNACEILYFAYILNASELRDITIEFGKKYFALIVKTAEWKELVKKWPGVVSACCCIEKR